MYRNSYNRKLEKAIKSLLVHCDRGAWEKANDALEVVHERLEELMQFTAGRIAIKEEREHDKSEAESPKESKEDSEGFGQDNEGSTGASEQVPPPVDPGKPKRASNTTRKKDK